MTEGWLQSEWDYRLYASGALEKIHSDTTVRKCLELLPQEKDLVIRTNLADALLSQFADEGIEPIREMVQSRAYDSMSTDLMRKLVAVSSILGVTFPEYLIWKRESEERLASQQRRMKEMWSFMQTPSINGDSHARVSFAALKDLRGAGRLSDRHPGGDSDNGGSKNLWSGLRCRR